MNPKSSSLFRMHLELVSGTGLWGLEWILGKNFKVNGGKSSFGFWQQVE